MTFGIDVDRAAFIDALRALAADIQAALNQAASITANNIAREAESRLRRQLGPASTGKTAAGIKVVPLGGVGYTVLAARNPYPNLPLWLDKGTQHMTARPFFDVAVQLEQHAYLRRIEGVVQDAIHEKGLGE